MRARIHPTALTTREALRRPLAQFGFVGAIFLTVLGLGFFPVQVAAVTTTPSVQASRLSLPGLAAVASPATTDALVSRAVPLTLVAPAASGGDAVVRPSEAIPRDGQPAGANDVVRAASAQQTDRVPVFFEYRVQNGDTVSGVASRFGIRSSYVSWNNADVTNANALTVGQTLQVPSVEGIIHSVRLGESVSEIAARYDANAQDIIEFRANGLQGDPNRLREGSQILVPGGRKVEIAATIAPPRSPAAAVAAATAAPRTNPVPNSAWSWPVRGLLTSSFGPSHPLGIDVAVPVGTPVVTAAAGTVTFVGGNPCCSYGYHIIVDNGAGYETLYAHLSAFAVQKGDKVAAGQRIGSSGNSGASTGPHVHFELHRGGRVQDPMQYLP